MRWACASCVGVAYAVGVVTLSCHITPDQLACLAAFLTLCKHHMDDTVVLKALRAKGADLAALQRLSTRYRSDPARRAQLINSGIDILGQLWPFDFSACRDEAEKKQRRSSAYLHRCHVVVLNSLLTVLTSPVLNSLASQSQL